MKILATAAGLVLAFVFTLSGCTTHDIKEGPAPGVRVEGAEFARLRMNSVAILDRDLQNWYVYEMPIGKKLVEHGKAGKIAVERTDSRRTATGTLETYALLRNRTNHDLQIEGRVQFFDQSEAPVEGPTTWQRLMLPANSVATYKEFSTLVDGINYYYIEIREGR